MPSVKISHTQQLHHENKTWIRLLEFFKQENYFMKNRLSEVLDHNIDKELLALAEQFQNKFILKDEYIDELRHDINRQVQLLDERPEPADPKQVRTHSKLRDQIEYFEKDFNKLKTEFNTYLLAVS